MTLLLDTHVVLWFLREEDRLSPRVRLRIQNKDNDVFVSVVSLWEIAIKHSLGKLALPRSFGELFPATLREAGLEILPITVAHLTGLTYLDHHHSDPFDRLIVSQAIQDDLTLVTRDAKLSAYGARTFWD